MAIHAMQRISRFPKLHGFQLGLALIWVWSLPVLSSFADSACNENGLSQLPEANLLEAFQPDIRSDRAALGFRSVLAIDANGRRTLRITHILEGGAAAEAGLEVGDVIVAMDGEALPPWANDLERVVWLDLEQRADDRIELTFERSGQRRRLSLTAERMSAAAQRERIRWVQIATERLEAGDGLYCAGSAKVAEARRWAEKRRHARAALEKVIAPYPQVRVVFTRLESGDFEIKTDPEIELPDDFSAHYFEDLEEQFENLQLGEELSITLMNPSYRG